MTKLHAALPIHHDNTNFDEVATWRLLEVKLMYTWKVTDVLRCTYTRNHDMSLN